MLQVRVFYMHRFGGMYADLDMEALRDLTPLLNDSTEPVLAYLSDTWTLRHNIPNAWMASPPGHPFWTPETLRRAQVRYPGWDLTPYRVAVG